jgi:putative ABC transport system permease protein
VIRLGRLLTLRPIRRRPLRALLAVVAMAAGTSMAVSVFIVRSSVELSVREFGRELSGPTELRVVGATRRGGLEPVVVDQVASSPGVDAAVPVVQTVTMVDLAEEPGRAGRDEGPEQRAVLVIGVDCRAEALVGPFGCTDELVADQGDRPLAVGPDVPGDGRLRTNIGTVSLRDVPVFDGLPSLGDGSFVVFSLASAQRVFDRGDRLDAVYIRPGERVDLAQLRQDLQEVVGPHNAVLTAEEGPPEVGAVLASVLPMFTLLALFGLATGAMLVYNTVTLSLEERRRELAVVGALGGTRSVVSSTALSEAGVLGLVGGLLGAGGGLAVAWPIVASLSTFTERTGGIPLDLHVGIRSLAVGAVLGVVVAALAAAVPVRRALRVEVAGELSGRYQRVEASAPRVVVRVVGWVLLLLAGLVMSRIGQANGGLEKWQVPVAAVGFGLAAVGMLLFGAAVAATGVRLLGRLLGGSAPVRLAVASLVRAPGRTGVMVAAVGAALTTAFVTAGYANSIRASISENVQQNIEGVEVSTVGEGSSVNLDAGLAPEVLDALAEVPGVDEVRRGAWTLAGSRSGDLVSVAAFTHGWLRDEDGEEQVRGRIDFTAFQQGEAVINTTLARDTGLRPGDELPLPTPTGMVHVPIQAVVRGGGATGRYAEVPWDLHEELYGPQPSRSVYVLAERSQDYDELAGRIRRSEFSDEVRVLTPTEIVEENSDSVDDQLLPFWTLQRGLLAVSFVAVLSTLLLVGVQRRREMGMLAAVGMEPSTLRRMVLAEAALVGLVAIAFGALGGVVMLWALLDVAPLLIGWSNPFRPDWTALPLWGVVAVVVSLLAALWPARRAARTDVIVALRYE